MAKENHRIIVYNKGRRQSGMLTTHDSCEYIGRPSPLGNPFVIGTDGDRAEVIEKYRGWLESLLSIRLFEPYTATTQEVRAEFDRLYEKYIETGELNLLCWCSPLPCHGDVIAEFIEKMASEEIANDMPD